MSITNQEYVKLQNDLYNGTNYEIYTKLKYFGYINKNGSNYTMALDAFIKAYNIYTWDKYHHEYISMIYDIGECYEKLDDHSNSLEYKNKGLYLYKISGKYATAAKLHKDLAVKYFYLNQYDISVYHYTEASTCYKLSNNILYYIDSIVWVAFIYALSDKHDISIEYFDKIIMEVKTMEIFHSNIQKYIFYSLIILCINSGVENVIEKLNNYVSTFPFFENTYEHYVINHIINCLLHNHGKIVNKLSEYKVSHEIGQYFYDKIIDLINKNKIDYWPDNIDVLTGEMMELDI